MRISLAIRRTDTERVGRILERRIQAELRHRVRGVRRRAWAPADVAAELEDIARLLALSDHLRGRRMREAHELTAMGGRIRELTPLAPTPLQEHASGLIVPTDVLHQLHQTLFPAERMAVVSGRQERGRTILGACFDVTNVSESSVSYTRADPEKLASALMAMEKSGTRIAAWAHSHPGGTLLATSPSETDRRQYSAWATDFGSLLALIFTRDGFVRFWGDLSKGAPSFHIEGKGIERSQHDVYRLAI
jgi:proteasome lid subunit RPN8/RPN11